MAKPVPRDLLVFLRDEVFPHVPRELVEEALSCSRLVLLHGRGAPGRGLYVVYSGSLRYRGIVYERGDYVYVEDPGSVEAEKEAVAIHVEPRCAEPLLRVVAEEPCRIGDLVHRSPVTVEPGVSVREAVAIMHRNGVSSVIVARDGRVEGIFTDTDLRRLVATGQPLDVPIGSVATPRPFSLPSSTPCSDAVYQMMERNVKHLLVMDDGVLRGVVTVRDIAYAEALGPLYVRRLIRSAGSVEELRSAYQRLLRVLSRFNRRLHPVTAGGEAATMVRMASLALRSVVEKAVALAAKELGAEPRGWAYLVMGSNARLEQPWPTDRDTALVYTGLGEEEARRLAEEAEDVLDRIGFPGCSHGYTARRLVMSLEEALRLLRRAAAAPGEDENIVWIGLFMDAVEAYPGGTGIDERLRRAIAEAVEASGSRGFIRSALAMYRPRLGPLGRLPSRIDLKKQGLAPIVFAVKALYLSSGLWSRTATLDRLEELAARGVVPEDTAAEAAEAYRVLLGFSAWSLAVRGSRELEASSLSGVERSLVRSALQAAARLVDRARSPG